MATNALARLDRVSANFDLDGEVLAEEDAGEAGAQESVRAIEPYLESSSPVLRTEVRTAAIAAAGGALAGAATVAAVRVMGNAVGSRNRFPRRLSGRRNERPANVLASRSFLVDVHLLGR